jgi:UDP-N-acetylglucosamine 2-epimerase (non-hydrolysing)
MTELDAVSGRPNRLALRWSRSCSPVASRDSHVKSKTILCVIGTRPEAIKMAPVVAALKHHHPHLKSRVLLTGQHIRMLHQSLIGFNINIDRNLAVMQENQSLAALTARLFNDLDPALAEEAPDLVVAQGDTTTVMVTATAAFYRGIPFAHVEAGLRTGNLQYPFPEEFNRFVVGRIATLNFAPTETAKTALLAEGADPSTIHVTGNTVIDALLETASRVSGPAIPIPDSARVILLTIHRRENFGEPMKKILAAVKKLAEMFADVVFIFPVHPNPNVRQCVYSELGSHPSFLLTEPLMYFDLVSILKRATIVLTDSGGLQEEAPALSKPVLVLRAETERPEAVTAGVAKLVGTRTDAIVRTVSNLLNDPIEYSAMTRGVSPFGDGHAAKRISAIIRRFLLDG